MKNKKSKGKSNIKEKINKIINDTISVKKKKEKSKYLCCFDLPHKNVILFN